MKRGEGRRTSSETAGWMASYIEYSQSYDESSAETSGGGDFIIHRKLLNK